MSAQEEEIAFNAEIGNMNFSNRTPQSEEDDEIDRINSISYWKVYACVFAWWVVMLILYILAIRNATKHGAVENAYPQKCQAE